jgi:threonine/homoserine efflux transporter RhtA
MGIWRSVSEASPRARAPADLRANASAAAAVYGLLAKRVLAVDSPATVTTWAMLFGAVLLLPVAVVEGLCPAIGRLDGQLLGVVVFLGVLGGAAAFLLWTWALSRLTPTQVAVYVNLNPVVAALLGVVLLGERRSGLFLLGFAAPSSPGSCWSTGQAGGPERRCGCRGSTPPDRRSRGRVRAGQGHGPMVDATRSSVR